MINWNRIIEGNKNGVRDFAVGKTSLRTLMNSSDSKVRRELRTKIERKHGSRYGRRLARKALRRRGLLS